MGKGAFGAGRLKAVVRAESPDLPSRALSKQDVKRAKPPLIEWLDGLREKARLKCLVRLKGRKDLGHELRRPEADYLRDGIYELRASYSGVHYRMLYFFHGRWVVVLTHGVVKEREVAAKEIDKAMRAKEAFERAPSAHTFKPER